MEQSMPMTQSVHNREEAIRAIFDREIETAERDYELSTYIVWLRRLRDEIVDALLHPERVPINENRRWKNRVTEIVDEAHRENLGGKHHSGFCEACADAYLVAQRAVPGGPGDD